MPILIAGVVALLIVVVAIASLRIRGRSASQAGSREAPARPEAVGPSAFGLGGKLRSAFAGGASDDAWAQLEDLLVRADVGPRASEELVARVRERVGGGAGPEESLIQEIISLLGDNEALNLHDGDLSVVMVVGVNGSGKTTTIGKLAKMFAAQGKKVALAASDTFRAAAGEQLDVWAERSGARLIAGERGADPGSVAFDAAKSAASRGEDVLIVDTAGRLHTRTPLMDELAKVKRVLEKAAGDVEEIVLVLDATTGQNGIAQAAAFTDAVGVTGVALTKMDGTAKGGIVLAVREELGVPVKLVGTGEGAADLQEFDPKAFAERLVRG